MENLIKQREDIFNFFKGFHDPTFSLTCVVECPNFLPLCKEKNVSSFQWTLYSLMKAILRVPEFSLRLMDDKIYQITHPVPSYTVLRKNGLYNYAAFRLPEDFSFEEFLHLSLQAKKAAEEASTLTLDDFSHRDYFYITCLPALNFTHVSHPIPSLRDCSIPCFAMGKYQVDKNDPLKLSFPLGIKAHHGFVDGMHASQLVLAFAEELAKEEFRFII